MVLAGEVTVPAIDARFGAPGSAKAVLEVKKSVTRTGATARRLKPRRSSGQSLYQNSETGETFGACRLRPPRRQKARRVIGGRYGWWTLGAGTGFEPVTFRL